MKREAESFLKRWISKPTRKPLIIKGARQVGKSTLVRQFAQSQNLNLVEINLEKHTRLDSVFASLDVSTIVKEIELTIGSGSIERENTLLFLDEVQATPHALQALRYFYEEKPSIAVITAGSLLEFTFSAAEFSMPVGRVEYLFLGPMTFKEFIAAKDELQLIDYMESWSLHDEFSEGAHNRLVPLLRDYIAVGGMPEAVKNFIGTNDYAVAAETHASIVQSYIDDFGKYAGKVDITLLHKVSQLVPKTVGNKFKYSSVSNDVPSGRIKPAVELLSLAGVISRVYHSDGTGIPLGANYSDNVYKTLFVDIGIMNHICGVRPLPIETFAEARLVNEGGIAEQVVGQALISLCERGMKPSLFYWLREGRQNNAEVDYLWQFQDRVIPVEVRAGKSGTLKSLIQFINDRKGSLAVRFDLNRPSLQNVKHNNVEFTILSMPLYMVSEINRLLSMF
jgi:predicted AAA+ superfamily ATPase